MSPSNSISLNRKFRFLLLAAWLSALPVALGASAGVRALPPEAAARSGLGSFYPPASSVANRPWVPPVDPAEQERRHQLAEYLDRRRHQAPPLTSEAVVVERGPHHARWETYQIITNLIGAAELRTNAYTELGTGMHYWHEGQWAPAQEVIEMHPTGAIARQGRHQVIFARNLNTVGSVDILTPDLKRLRGHVLGLYYHDRVSGRFVLLAQLQDCAGELLPPNQILYRNAFQGLRADVCYTYRRRGLEQDVILRERPHPPEAYGLNPASTQLEAVTEFMTPPLPTKRLQHVRQKQDPQSGAVQDLQDEELDFGEMQMMPGRAFMLAPAEAGGAPRPAGMVVKRWVEDNGRVFLIEAVDFDDVKVPLADLPLVVEVPKREAVGQGVQVARTYPLTPKPARDAKPVMLASLPMESLGLVLDFDLSGMTNNYTFRADTTYYLGSAFGVSSNATFEGGTVLKYGNTNASTTLGLLGPVVWPELVEAPAIFTAKDDNTVGSVISGSTGNPTNYYAAYAIYMGTTNLIKNVRIRYADTGIWYPSGGTNELRHAQFVKCNTAVYGMNTGHLYSRNVLMHDCQTGYYLWAFRASAEHLTMNKCNYLYIRQNFGSDYNPVFFLTNSLVVAATNVDTTYWVTNQVGVASSSNGVFQTVGAGGHYLVGGSTHRNIGVTNIAPALLTEIRSLTTYPPVVLSNTISLSLSLSPQAARDTDLPDLGYHYAPLDYAVSGVVVDNSSTVNVTPGTVVGLFGWEGFLPRTACQFLAAGTPLNRIRFATYETAQELPLLWGKSSAYSTLPINTWTSTSSDAGPRVRFRFTDFTTVQHDNGALVYAMSGGGNYYPFTELLYQDCTFGAAKVYLGYTYAGGQTYKNNQFARTYFSWTGNVDLQFYNNLFRRCATDVNKTGANALVARDNIFYESTFSCTGLTNVTVGYNAYVNQTSYLGTTNGTDVILSQLVFQTGALGGYYLNQTNALINTGSRAATNAGLYHYTTATNQTKEGGSTVDIGFHYLALNGSGLPVDSDSDGIPDYVEDWNGNGAVDGVETNPSVFSSNESGVSDGLLDSDYDGVRAMDEYLEGTSPFDATSFASRRLGYWRFNNTSTWPGEQGQSPKVVSNVTGLPSWDGYALRNDNAGGARLAYNEVETNGLPNINCREGSVNFWFRPKWSSVSAGGSGPGSWGRLIELGAWTGDSSYGNWQVHLNPEGNQLFFFGQTNGAANGYLFPSISWTSNVWHQVTLSYCPAGVWLFVDGVCLQGNAGPIIYPSPTVRAADGFSIGSNRYSSEQALGDFEELETYNYALTGAEVLAKYNAVVNGDDDGDGVANYLDGRPKSSATTAMTITIEAPAVGSVIR